MIILVTLHLLAWVALALAAYGAYHDVRHLRIENTISLTITGLALAALLFQAAANMLGLLHAPVLGGWGAHLISGGAVFAIGYVLFAAKLWGGGDAKLAASLALWLPVQALPAFPMTMSLIGAVLALVTLLAKHKPQLIKPIADKYTDQQGWVAALANGENALPYGVAITAGACHAFLLMGYLA